MIFTVNLITNKYFKLMINNFCSNKKKLPELIAIGNKFISKDIENKSNLLLQDQLNKSNKLIDILRQENIHQKAEVIFINVKLFYYVVIHNWLNILTELLKNSIHNRYL